MTAGPLSYICKLIIKEGREDAFAALAAKLTHDTRQEPGCVHYAFLRDPENRRHFTLIEQFRDMDAMVAHGARLKRELGPAPEGTQGLPRAISEYFESVEFRRVEEISAAP